MVLLLPADPAFQFLNEFRFLCQPVLDHHLCIATRSFQCLTQEYRRDNANDLKPAGRAVLSWLY